MNSQTAIGAALKQAFNQADPKLVTTSKAMKSKVSASSVGTGTMAEDAMIEAKLIIEHGTARMKHWVTTANKYRTQPELLTKYPEALRNALYTLVKLPIPTALAPKSQWTDEQSIRLANTLDVEVSQCRRAFNALATQFQATVKMLEGKGTYQDKIKALPKQATSGRKPRQPKGEEETGEGKVKGEHPTVLTLRQMIATVNSMNENDLSKVIQAVAIRCKDSKLAVMNRLGTDLFKALDEYDGTAQAVRDAAKAGEAEKIAVAG